MELTFNTTEKLALSHMAKEWQGFDQPQDLYPSPWLAPTAAYPSLQEGDGKGMSPLSPWSYLGLSGQSVYGPVASDLKKLLSLCLRLFSAQADQHFQEPTSKNETQDLGVKYPRFFTPCQDNPWHIVSGLSRDPRKIEPLFLTLAARSLIHPQPPSRLPCPPSSP